MADLQTFWAPGFWATGFWADDFWAGGAVVAAHGNAVVPNTVADLQQLFKKTAYGIPPAPTLAAAPMRYGPTLADITRERAAKVAQEERDTWLTVIALALHDFEDE